MSKKNPKPLNVGQQPNPPDFQKVYSETLQAKNLGVDKILLNINGANSEIPTNRNSIIKYSLKQPVVLEPGDMVTLVSSFVEEKGLAENTISFENDFETEMRFLYYKQFDCGDMTNTSDDVGWCPYPKLLPDFYTGASDDRKGITQGFLNAQTYGYLYSDIVCDCNINMDYTNKVYTKNPDGDNNQNGADLTSGANGQIGYLMETSAYEDTSAANNMYYRPVYGRKIIKVPAGNYSTDALANIISEQMNGSIGKDNNDFSDALLDKLYRPNASFNGGGSKFCNTLPFFRNITGTEEDVANREIFGNEPSYKSSGTQLWDRKVEGMVRQIFYSNSSWYESYQYNQLTVDINNTSEGRLPPGDKYPNGQVDTTNYPLRGSDDAGDYREVDLTTLLQPSATSGNSAAVNFYAGANHLYNLFENDYEGFYCNPKLKDGTLDFTNDYFRPPRVVEMLQCQVGVGYGIVPFYGSNGAAYEAKYPNSTRLPNNGDAMTFNTLWPVNGLKFPGEGGLIPPRNKFAGTSVAELTFSDATANRFAFQNFHEFYKLPNLTADVKTTTDYGGQQATMFNNPFYNGSAGGSETDNIPVAATDSSCAVYPVDSSSGIMINNFAFDLCTDTDVYKNAIKEIRALDNDVRKVTMLYKEKLYYDLITKPFDKFFATPADAQVAWEKSLWFRLGFNYNQLGDISSQVESTSTFGGRRFAVFNPEDTPNPNPRFIGRQEVLPNKGIITHNQFDFSKIVSADGLGVGNPVSTGNTSGVPLQMYRLADYYFSKQLNKNLGLNGNMIHLLAESKPLNAQNLPSLSNGKSYLLIESDIIKPNFKDVRADWGNLLGIMSKENATNDTIFGAEPIDFTITEPRLLSDITIYIKNPDGTLADDRVVGKNCGFIIQITKPIKPQEVPQLDPP
tara:strand:- start:7151 stop:9865 length:2715 start_codon:yes stop_codon:yes gene_type:complete